ncbi:MAG: PhzF family phenazine biosynthesis protein [Candidatus Polarisedimenticolia bacterium]
MPIEIFHVDAFTRAPFAGNPAGVCVLSSEMPESWLQSMGAEMNLSETAFVMPGTEPMRLRWFTPTTEVALCGHATLATAHVLWENGRLDRARPASFSTLSGILRAEREGDAIRLILPAMRLREGTPPPPVVASLRGAPIVETREVIPGAGERDWLVRLDSEAAVRQAQPDFQLLRQVHAGLIVTAPASMTGMDFVSRYFAPSYGIDEDPVTGAAHCSLIPYWAALLGRSELCGYQASPRGGVVRGRPAGDHVELIGHAVTVMRGQLSDAAVRGGA